MKQMKGSSTDPGLVLLCRPPGDYFIIADSICDLMQLLEISKDSIESVPVTHDNRLINHSPRAAWHLQCFFLEMQSTDPAALLDLFLFILLIMQLNK